MNLITKAVEKEARKQVSTFRDEEDGLAFIEINPGFVELELTEPMIAELELDDLANRHLDEIIEPWQGQVNWVDIYFKPEKFTALDGKFFLLIEMEVA